MQDCRYVQCFVNIHTFFFNFLQTFAANCFGSLLFTLILIMEIHPSLVHPSIHHWRPACTVDVDVFVVLVCATVDIFHPLLLKPFWRQACWEWNKTVAVSSSQNPKPCSKTLWLKVSMSIDRNISSHRTFPLTLAETYEPFWHPAAGVRSASTPHWSKLMQRFNHTRRVPPLRSAFIYNYTGIAEREWLKVKIWQTKRGM